MYQNVQGILNSNSYNSRKKNKKVYKNYIQAQIFRKHLSKKGLQLEVCRELYYFLYSIKITFSKLIKFSVIKLFSTKAAIFPPYFKDIRILLKWKKNGKETPNKIDILLNLEYVRVFFMKNHQITNYLSIKSLNALFFTINTYIALHCIEQQTRKSSQRTKKNINEKDRI